MPDEIETPPVLKEIEDKLKDRFKDYLIVATDGSEVYCLNSSQTAGIGLGRYASLRAEKELLTDA